MPPIKREVAGSLCDQGPRHARQGAGTIPDKGATVEIAPLGGGENDRRQSRIVLRQRFPCPLGERCPIALEVSDQLGEQG